MSGLWNIFKGDGQQLGPYSASEIREALRDGSIDPFDQVARIGSKLKQSLVEVDEIFLEADSGIPKVDSVYDQNDELVNRGHNLSSTTHSLPNRGRRNRATAVSPRPLEDRKPLEVSDRQQPNFRGKKANQANKYAKRFYLLDRRNRLLGPLSAAEIQSLFYRGVIDQDVLVSKDKGDKRVPVQQFIAAYVGAKAKKFKSEQTRLHLEPGGQYAYPSSRVMDQISRSAIAMRLGRPGHFPWLSLGLLLLAMVLSGIMIKAIFFSTPANQERLKRDREFPQSVEIQGEVHPQTQPIEQPQPRPQNVQQSEGSRVKPVADQKRKVTASQTRQRKAQAPIAKPKPATKVQPRPLQRRMSQPRQVKPYFPPNAPSTPKLAPQRVIPAKQTPQRQQPVRRVVAPKDPYQDRVGTILTIASARYSVNEVASCNGIKCTVTFRDRSGTSFAGVFFRARYQEQLKKAGGQASILGRLDKKDSGYIIYLSGVR